jgi:Photosynthetic reaction centre cytochrome C subunit
MNYRTPTGVLVMALFILLPLSAQDRKETTTTAEPPAPPTNLKVLKVATRAEVEQIMRTFTAGLGVQCNYCHAQDTYASDDNPKKEVARRMLKMVQKINEDFPDSKMHVSCYTCHRGETEPKTAPGQ